MSFDMLKILKGFKKEGQEIDLSEFFDVEKFNAQINIDVGKFVAKDAEKSLTKLKDTLIGDTQAKIIKSLNIADVDTLDKFKAHVNTLSSTTTEKDTEITRLNNELTAKGTEFDTLNGKYIDVNGKYQDINNKELFTTSKFDSNLMSFDDLLVVANSKVNEDNDMASVIKTMAESTHKKYLLPVEEGNGKLPKNKNDVDITIDEEQEGWAKQFGVEL